jgi:hypothetical protein
LSKSNFCAILTVLTILYHQSMQQQDKSAGIPADTGEHESMRKASSTPSAAAVAAAAAIAAALAPKKKKPSKLP